MSSQNSSDSATTKSPVSDQTRIQIDFANTYARLPAQFYARVNPTPVIAPQLAKLNSGLAQTLGLKPDLLASTEGIAILGGNHVAVGSEPIALAYAGHQFGHFVPQLGDGRANLLGELIAPDGQRFDIQLKGSGRTPFSRGGDGRAALGPVLREYLVSEAMAALGVPTTRALAAVITGEDVYRETVLPGAVLTRVASSHLRVGTFQYFAARGDVDGLRTLAAYAMARHYPDAAEAKHPYRALLDGVIARQANLIAQWMLLGFIHGVMNTDNMSISGETIDYGPCAFMEAYNPSTVFSAIDRMGRYAYANQPAAAHWNLTRLAEAMLPILAIEAGGDQAALNSANDSLAGFVPLYETVRLSGFRTKLGLFTERAEDAALIEEVLSLMALNQADFTLTFRNLCEAASGNDQAVRKLFQDSSAYDEWSQKWHKRMDAEDTPAANRIETMKRTNPAFIPRNHLVQAVIDAAVERKDLQPFEDLIDATSRPYEDRPDLLSYMTPARPEERILQTFCGT